MKQELTVEFGDLVVTRDVEVLALVLGEKFKLLAPCDAHVAFTFGYNHARCEVRCYAFRFAVESFSDDPLEALRHLDRQVMMQISRWKSLRFQSATPVY